MLMYTYTSTKYPVLQNLIRAPDGDDGINYQQMLPYIYILKNMPVALTAHIRTTSLRPVFWYTTCAIVGEVRGSV